MCAAHITAFWDLDGAAQVGSHDVQFNAGYFPHMCAALGRRDYVAAAAEANRKVTPDADGNQVPGGISKARNNATKALILSAVQS